MGLTFISGSIGNKNLPPGTPSIKNKIFLLLIFLMHVVVLVLLSGKCLERESTNNVALENYACPRI